MTIHPPDDLLDAWLAAYPSISQIAVCGQLFYIRPLSRAEFKSALRQGTGNIAFENEAIAAAGCLWPEYDFADPNARAAIPAEVAKEVRRISAREPRQAFNLFTHWRKRIADQEERWDLLILTAFQNLTYEQLENMQPDAYFRYLAAAEFRTRLQIKTTVSGEFFDPEELVDLLLCTTDDLHERLARADKEQAQSNGTQPPAPQPQAVTEPDITAVATQKRANERKHMREQLQYETTRRGPYGRN